MKAFIYARYSTGPNQKEISIEGQLRECREYAETHGIDVMGEYADHGRSGRTDNREDFRRLMRDVEARVVDIVLVWKLDRFFRNRAESALYRKHLETFGVRLVSIRELVPDGSAGIITTGMLETLAEWYSAQLSENVIRGMYDTARKGLSTGSYPLGYKVGDDKRLHIDPVGAEIVQRIYKMYDAGASMAKISKALNEEGHKTRTGKPFTANSLQPILRNVKYIGIIKYGDTVELKDGCPRIVSDELFFRVQRKLEINKSRPGAGKASTDFALSGKLFCGRCHAPMCGVSGHSRNGTRHYYYACGGHYRHKNCSMKNVRQADIEEAVFQAALSVLNDSSIEFIAREVARQSATASENKALLASLNAQLAEVEAKLKNVGKAIAAGIITETTKALLEESEADRASLRKQIEIAKVQASLSISFEQIAGWLDHFRTGDSSDPAFRKEVFSALVDRVFVYDDYLKIVFNSTKSGNINVPYKEIDKTVPCSNIDELGQPNSANPNIFFIGTAFGLQYHRLSRW